MHCQVVWAGAPGQEAGNSLVDILYGDWNPTGRLPYTIAKSPSDYSAKVITEGSWSTVTPIPYTEGSVCLASQGHFGSWLVSLTVSKSTTATLMQYVSLFYMHDRIN